jgi:hypothetical protein
MAVFCQNLTLGALSSRSALSVLVDALFKKFGLFLNTAVSCACNAKNYALYSWFVQLIGSATEGLAIKVVTNLHKRIELFELKSVTFEGRKHPNCKVALTL